MTQGDTSLVAGHHRPARTVYVDRQCEVEHASREHRADAARQRHGFRAALYAELADVEGEVVCVGERQRLVQGELKRGIAQGPRDIDRNVRVVRVHLRHAVRRGEGDRVRAIGHRAGCRGGKRCYRVARDLSAHRVVDVDGARTRRRATGDDDVHLVNRRRRGALVDKVRIADRCERAFDDVASGGTDAVQDDPHAVGRRSRRVRGIVHVGMRREVPRKRPAEERRRDDAGGDAVSEVRGHAPQRLKLRAAVEIRRCQGAGRDDRGCAEQAARRLRRGDRRPIHEREGAEALKRRGRKHFGGGLQIAAEAPNVGRVCLRGGAFAAGSNGECSGDRQTTPGQTTI